MKSLHRLLLFLLTVGCFFSFSSFCDEKEYEKGEVLAINPQFLHPTQAIYGRIEVEWYIKNLKDLMNDEGVEAVRDYFKKKSGKIIIGPKNSKWLVDGHHHAKALDVLIKSDKRFRDISFYVEVIKEWNELTAKEFEQAMKKGNKKGETGTSAFVYLKDLKGMTKSFNSLPKRLSSLKDSPFRSVVWILKKEGIIEESDNVPFQEFVVADYLRKHIKITPALTPKDYERILKEAIVWIKKADKSDLPGFIKKTTSQCVKVLETLELYIPN
ncbi:MAG: hypothetical protein EXR74_09010 [Bdellovibrionales bacterium]|nr:hypothetical protein [Bdellovibrionales bacterium]